MRALTGIALVIAVLAGASTVFRVGVLPPSLTERSLEIGAASTKVLVDTPQSKVVDLGAATADFQALATRANLLANVMASAPVRAKIEAHAGVPRGGLVAEAPIIANVPRASTEPGSEKRASDLLAETEQYRLNIQANPQVPIINVYAQAPSGEAAARLADGAIAGLRQYLEALAASQGIPESERVRLHQLGRPRGGVVNEGAGLQMALLSALTMLVLLCAAILLLPRVVMGWFAAGRATFVAPVERAQPVTEGDEMTPGRKLVA